jgi:GNAT superfamily N-acetyltransferase
LSIEYDVRPFQLGDEEELVKLLDLGFKGWPNFDLTCSSLDHWKWKFKDNPMKTFFIVIGVHNKKIIGCGHEIPQKIKIGDKFFACNYAADLTVHPDFRRIGITKKMIELIIKLRKDAGVEYVYYSSRNPTVIKNLSKKYLRFPKTLLNLVRIRNINQQLKSMPMKNALLMKMGFRSAKSINKFRKLIIPEGQKDSGIDGEITISKIDRFDKEVEEFWKQVSSHYEFILERNLKYLNWRYCDRRAGGFVVKKAEFDGQILGFSVLKINQYRRDYPVGYFVDLLTLPNMLNVANKLVEDAIGYFDTNNVNIINSLVVKNHPHVRTLKRNGFLDSRIKPVIFYWGKELEKIKNISSEKVHFSYGDIDSLPTRLI